MVYSFWAVFVVIVAIVRWKIRDTKAKYLLAQAEEKEKAELEARMNKPTVEFIRAREHLYAQYGITQGQSTDLAKMLGTQVQKGVH